MKSFKLALLTLSCIIFLSGCDITFKRKTSPSADKQHQTVTTSDGSAVNAAAAENVKNIRMHSDKIFFSDADATRITQYYADESNSIIVQDIITQTHISEKQAEKLTVAERVPNGMQVMPLPLALEKSLSPLPQNMLRLQIGKRIVLMDVKSRQIYDVIKF